MKRAFQILREYEKKKGLRHTSQREAVLSCLAESKHHRSPEEIYDALRRQKASLGRATVFRTLKILEACGLASHVTDARGVHRFEAALGRPHHDHMICVACGRALEFESPAIEKLQERIARQKKFHISWHRHEIFGTCDRCVTTRPSRNGSNS